MQVNFNGLAGMNRLNNAAMSKARMEDLPEDAAMNNNAFAVAKAMNGMKLNGAAHANAGCCG